MHILLTLDFASQRTFYSFFLKEKEKKKWKRNVRGLILKNSYLPKAPLSKNHEKVEICQLHPVQIVGWHTWVLVFCWSNDFVTSWPKFGFLKNTHTHTHTKTAEWEEQPILLAEGITGWKLELEMAGSEVANPGENLHNKICTDTPSKTHSSNTFDITEGLKWKTVFMYNQIKQIRLSG